MASNKGPGRLVNMHMIDLNYASAVVQAINKLIQFTLVRCYKTLISLLYFQVT